MGIGGGLRRKGMGMDNQQRITLTERVGGIKGTGGHIGGRSVETVQRGRGRAEPAAWIRILTLFLLYLVQGLPYGFFVSVLPVFLRQAGWSRTAIGFYGVLGLPWLLKALWAPLVDRFRWPGVGRRKGWILPCMGGLAGLLVLLSGQEPRAEAPVLGLLIVVFAINLITATQDIAVDGLAVDVLSPTERGPGNAAQVIGFKAGMLLSGGLLLALSDRLGWQGICLGMAGVCGVVLLVAWAYPEAGLAGGGESEALPLSRILGSLVSLLRRPGVGWFVLLIGTYKLGEAGVDAMYKLFLLDAGMQPTAIGWLCGSWGLGFSLGGSLAGGWIGRGRDRLGALFGVGLVRACPLLAIAVLPHLAEPLRPGVLVPVTLAEHFAGGLITPILFAFMMDLCDRRVGATHYTALAAVEVAGKMGISVSSGWIADVAGYGGLFALGAAVSLLWPALIPVARRRAAVGSDRPTGRGAVSSWR